MEKVRLELTAWVNSAEGQNWYGLATWIRKVTTREECGMLLNEGPHHVLEIHRMARADFETLLQLMLEDIGGQSEHLRAWVTGIITRMRAEMKITT